MLAWCLLKAVFSSCCMSIYSVEGTFDCLALDINTGTLYYSHFGERNGTIGTVSTDDGHQNSTLIVRPEMMPRAIVLDTNNR